MLNPEIVAQFKDFSIGPLTFNTYGFILGIALLTATFLFYRFGPKSITKHSTFDLLIVYTVVPAVILGRLLFVFVEHNYFVSNPLEIFALWDGGVTIFGVLLGGVLGYSVYWWTRVKSKPKSYPYLLFPDCVVPFVALGQVIGRWGNFINQELYGFPTSKPWGMYISPENRLDGYEQYEFFHPTFLYESVLSLIAFGILFFLYRKLPEKTLGKGFLFGLYLLMYGCIRIMLERIRIDSIPVLWEIKLADLGAVLLILIGSALIIHGTKRARTTKKR